MILIEILVVVVVIATMFGLVPGLQEWLKGSPAGPAATACAPPSPQAQGPGRLMARLVQPDPFPGTISGPVPVTVMVVTVTDGSFAPEVGASVSFTMAKGFATVNGSKAITQVTDQLGTVTAQVMGLRSGLEELTIAVVGKGASMPVTRPIYFEIVA